MSRDDFRFVHLLRVRWAEVDMQGIVFNGHNLTYLDVAMTEYCRAIGYPYPQGLTEGGTDLFVAHAELDYHGSAALDDDLEIGTRIARLGRSSLHFLFEILRGEELLITGRLVYVNAGPETRRSAPIPESIRQAHKRRVPDVDRPLVRPIRLTRENSPGCLLKTTTTPLKPARPTAISAIVLRASA